MSLLKCSSCACVFSARRDIFPLFLSIPGTNAVSVPSSYWYQFPLIDTSSFHFATRWASATRRNGDACSFAMAVERKKNTNFWKEIIKLSWKNEVRAECLRSVKVFLFSFFAGLRYFAMLSVYATDARSELNIIFSTVFFIVSLHK